MLREANVTVMVSDLNRAIRFYTQILGLRLRYRTGDDWAEVMLPGLIIGLQPAPRPPVPPHEERRARPRVSIGFTVEKIEVARDVLQRRGVQFGPDIDEDDTIRIATFSDPDGTPLYLCELRREML